VRELLRPLLQQWLDENLPVIVQQAVESEVERIARGRVR
jgi:cell pole-organizing protein PopZ